MDENKVIENYLKPVLGDLMDKSLNAILELKSNDDGTALKQNKKFFLEFLKDASEYYQNNTDKHKSTVDLISYIENL